MFYHCEHHCLQISESCSDTVSADFTMGSYSSFLMFSLGLCSTVSIVPCSRLLLYRNFSSSLDFHLDLDTFMFSLLCGFPQYVSCSTLFPLSLYTPMYLLILCLVPCLLVLLFCLCFPLFHNSCISSHSD